MGFGIDEPGLCPRKAILIPSSYTVNSDAQLFRKLSLPAFDEVSPLDLDLSFEYT